MSDDNEKEETRREEQQDLAQQQQGLFRELSREQIEAEKALQEDQEGSVSGKPQDERED